MSRRVRSQAGGTRGTDERRPKRRPAAFIVVTPDLLRCPRCDTERRSSTGSGRCAHCGVWHTAPRIDKTPARHFPAPRIGRPVIEAEHERIDESRRRGPVD